MPLWNRFCGPKLARMQFAVREVVVTDAEMFLDGYAKGESTTCPEIVSAGGDRSQYFGPFSVLGARFVGGL